MININKETHVLDDNSNKKCFFQNVSINENIIWFVINIYICVTSIPPTAENRKIIFIRKKKCHNEMKKIDFVTFI